MLYFASGSPHMEFSNEMLRDGLFEALDRLGPRNRVLAIPPDYTRRHSGAGELTQMAHAYYGPGLTDILPALGTHSAMTPDQLEQMFPQVPRDLFRVHNWRQDLDKLGEVPSAYIDQVSEGQLDYAVSIQINKQVSRGGHDLIVSIGQVVPHEVSGMANYNKNVLVGTGGSEVINKTHYLGAVYGMERIMGQAMNPVRQVLNYAADNFLGDLPILYVLTVIGKKTDGGPVVKGLFIGDDMECFELAAALSLQVNFEMLDSSLEKVVVYLDPAEFKSTWLGNKSIYRTRMAIADGGELIILAPGLREFGEDKEIDRLIREFGYLTTPEILAATQKNPSLQNNLSAAAHLIHGSAEGRFNIIYCPGHLTREEIEGANYQFGLCRDMMTRYDPRLLTEGSNTLPDGEVIYYISNPALGLWASKERLFDV